MYRFSHSHESQAILSCDAMSVLGMYVRAIGRPSDSLQVGEARSKSAKDVVRELYAGVDLPKLVQRMLVVMHEVSTILLKIDSDGYVRVSSCCAS